MFAGFGRCLGVLAGPCHSPSALVSIRRGLGYMGGFESS